MRPILISMILVLSSTASGDERTEARVGPNTQATPDLAAATADQAAAKPKGQAQTGWIFPGSWSGAYEADSGVKVGPDTTRFHDALRQRFIAGAAYTGRLLKANLSLSIYAYDGVSSVDADQSFTRPIDLNQAFIEYRSPVGLWRAGVTQSRWGLGLVAGGRSAYSSLTHDFHFATPSDMPAGLTYGLKLGAWTLGLSGAFVLRDENADLLEGDRAQQGVVVLRYQPSTANWLGVYSAYRRQRDADDSTLTALLIDLAGAAELPVGASDRLRLAFEAAYLQGDTDRSLSEAAFAADQDLMTLQAFGGAAVAGFETMNRRLAIELEAGYASADRNAEDSQLTRFTFDDNYGVGMILVRGLLRHSHELAVERSSDPNRVGQPQRGLDRLKTQGRLAGVTYANLRSSYRIKSGKMATGLHVGAVIAALPQGSADPYQSFRQGSPVNAFGQESASDLGLELNTGITWSARLQRRYALRLSLEGAAAQPGAAIRGAESSSIMMVRTGFTLRALEKEMN